ncbi:50S ribosomal protein L21, chloroplastic [Heracleum sosnowskyi]|uniref:50S ribosomal protein L21, chloroplastic n=1 Tax=Heracleum sosnowskyi TaxID=360622 RepID=A0AAD8HTJ9_9APIA|nr:50S ribosomal protein L21, chloroplastic [Heracleum sosnowskyi]
MALYLSPSSLSSSLSSPKQNPLSLSLHKPNCNFLSHHFSSLTLSTSFKPTFSFITRLSQTDSPVVVEPEPELETGSGPELEEAQVEESEVVEGVSEEAKKEDVFAVVMIGGRQYIVFPGRFLYTQRLKGANVNDKVILNKVLLVGTKTSTYLGQPVVPNAAVHAVVEEQGLNDKVIVYKYKKKKNYRRNIGHRQPNTRIRIMGITGYENSPALTLP